METEHTVQPSADDAVEVLRAIWDTAEDDRQALEECRPGHHCKNMRHVSFDDLGEGETDAATAWRELLAREGKLDTSGGTIRDLVLGRATDR